MAKSENQKLKILYLLEYLRRKTDENHDGVTTEQIIEHLASKDISAERKSIYSDIRSLRDMGYDIINEKIGRQTYYKLVSRDFDLAEIKVLTDAVRAFKFISGSKSNELLKKIEGLASDADAKELRRNLIVSDRAKSSEKGIFIVIDKIQSAINNGRQITFRYFRWNSQKKKEYRHDGKTYTVSPWALIFQDENYYMLGYDSDDDKMKNFRVDKLDNVRIADEKRKGEKDYKAYDMSTYTTSVFNMYVGRKEKVDLLVSNSLANVMIDRFGKEMTFFPRPDDRFLVTLDVYTSPQFYGWLAGLGPDVKVVSPENVAEGYKAHLLNILENY